MTELWKDIPGFEGYYQVSDQGRVRSLDYQVHCRGYTTKSGQRRSGYTRTIEGRVLRPGTMPGGHQSVCLGRTAGSQCVHSLVLAAFVGPPPQGHEVLHLNHNPADNRLNNLRYGTRSENLRMDYSAGTRTPKRDLVLYRWGHKQRG